MSDQFGGWGNNFLLEDETSDAKSIDAESLGGWDSNFLLGDEPATKASPPPISLAEKYAAAYQDIVAQAHDPTEQGQDAYNRNLKLAADMEQANRGAITGSAPYRVAEDIVSASASAIVDPLLSLEAKLGISGADDMLQQRQADRDISHLREMGWTQRTVGGIGESIGQYATLALAGGGAASALGAAGKAAQAIKWAVVGSGIGQQSYSQTHRDALKDGKTEEEADKIATATAALEVGVMGLFQKIGLGGAERAIVNGLGVNSARGAAERASLQGLKNFLKQTAGELAEEEITTLTQALAQTAEVGGWEAYRDTAIATIGTMGLLSGSQKFLEFTSNPSRRTAKAAGLGELAATQRQREDIADNSLLAAAHKINTDWVKTDPASTAMEGEVVDEPAVATAAKPEFTGRDEETLAALTKRLKRKLRSAGFRPDEMGVTIDNFEAWFRDRGYLQFHPGVRTVGVTTNNPEPPAPSAEPTPSGPTASDEGNSFASGIPIGKETARWFRRNFFSGGEQNEPTKNLVFRRDSIIRKHNAAVQQGIRDLTRAAKKANGIKWWSKIPDALSRQLNEALQDPAVAAQLPTDVAVEVQKIRDHIDGLSSQIQALGGVGTDLFLTIEQNKGHYVTRSYRKFDDPDGWRKKAMADPQIMGDFAAEVRQSSPNATDQEVLTLAETLLRRNTMSSDDLQATGSRTQNYVNVLKQRKNLSDAVRALYGENKDVFVNYANTVGQMANLVANKGFVQNLRADWLAQGFFSLPGSQQPTHVQEVAYNQHPQLADLAGILMEPELASAINELYAMKGPGRVAQIFATASGAVKAGKTVGAFPRAYVRNLIGNLPITLANGNWFHLQSIADFGKAAKATVMDDLLNQGTQASKDQLQRLKELGVVESFTLEELKDAAAHAATAAQTFIEGVSDSNPVKKTFNSAARLYQAMDTVSKIHNYHAELRTQQEAFPTMPLHEQEERAARIVRATNPTYSEASKAAKFWARYVPFGSFAMFSAEIMRTTGNRMRLAGEELRSGNSALMRQGAKRLIGQGVALAGTTALANALMQMFGTAPSEDKEKAMRERLPPWQRNSALLVTSVDEKGNPIDYLDLDYNDPFGIFTKAATAIARGESDEAIDQIAEPFLSEDIFAGTIVSIIRGRDEFGRPIYSEGATPEEQNRQLIKFIAKKLEPGVVSSYKRISTAAKGGTTSSGLPLKLSNEIASNLGGMRKENFSRDVADYYRNREFDQKVKASQSLIRKQFFNKGTFDPEEVRRQYESAEATRRQTLKEWREYVDGSVALGEENPYGKVVRDVGQESSIIKMMYSKQYAPYRLRDSDFAQILKLPQGAERVKLFQELYQQGIAPAENHYGKN